MPDAETYLRLLGEDGLRAMVDDLPRHARAVVAIGDLDVANAQRVVDDYAHARRLRGLEVGPSAQAAAPLTNRIAACPARIDLPGAVLEVHSVEFSDQTKVSARFTYPDAGPSARRAAPGRQYGRGVPFQRDRPHVVRIADDRGVAVDAHLEGQSSGDLAEGALVTDRPLRPDTTHLTIAGRRIELRDVPMTVRPVPADLSRRERALRHLAHTMAVDNDLQPIVDTYVALGALGEADQVDVTPVGRGPREPSLGAVLVGAVTPPFEGVRLVVQRLDRTPTGFTVSVTVRGRGPTSETTTRVDEPAFDFRAVDDLGGVYRGRLGGYSFTNDQFDAELEFGPALDDRVRAIQLQALTDRHTAEVRIELHP